MNKNVIVLQITSHFVVPYKRKPKILFPHCTAFDEDTSRAENEI